MKDFNLTTMKRRFKAPTTPKEESDQRIEVHEGLTISSNITTCNSTPNFVVLDINEIDGI